MNPQSHIRLTAISFGLGILVSPDTFVALGNFMGNAGRPGLWIVLGVMGIFFIIAGDNSPWTSVTPIFIVVKFVTAVFLSTGILVSSGFVFNEVFVYWFPNFGFAFLLLAIVLGMQLTGPEKALKAQVLWVGITLIAFAVIIIASLGAGGANPAGTAVQKGPFQNMGNLSLPLLLWVGFDLARSGPGRDAGKMPSLTVVAMAGCLFFLWGLVSISHVPLERLAYSGLPHMKVAKAVLGESGRVIMGVAVISGTLSAVNALFLGCGYGVMHLAEQSAFPRWAAKSFVPPTVLALAVGLMMALGMAGSEKLEVWIRAAFLLWLLGYIRPELTLMGCLPAGLLIAGAFAIVVSGEQPLLTLVYMGFTLGAGITLEFISKKLSHHHEKRSLS